MNDEARREKMVLLGNLMGGLVHEVRTPLAAILSNNDVLEETFRRLEAFIQGSPETRMQPGGIEDVLAIARECFKTQRLACDRLDDLARTVLNFMRSDSETWTKGLLHEILENALALTAHVLRGRIVVVRELGKVSEIDCHPNELSQVFINLIINAAQAIEGTGEIRVRTWEAQGLAAASISDTGVGMTSEVQAHLFEPGFTTKEKSEGTGLGLSLCLKTVQNHGGRIEVQSQPGVGSTFVVFVPVTQPERKGNG